MNTLATNLSILLRLCCDIPIEIISIIVSFMLIPKSLNKNQHIEFDYPDFALQREKNKISKYYNTLISEDDFFKLTVIQLFYEALMKRIHVLPYIHLWMRWKYITAITYHKISEIFAPVATKADYPNSEYPIFILNNIEESNLPVALKLFEFAIS